MERAALWNVDAIEAGPGDCAPRNEAMSSSGTVNRPRRIDGRRRDCFDLLERVYGTNQPNGKIWVFGSNGAVTVEDIDGAELSRFNKGRPMRHAFFRLASPATRGILGIPGISSDSSL